jgi:hypothetical protein
MINRILSAFGYVPTPPPPPATKLNEVEGDPYAALGNNKPRLVADTDEVLRKIGWHRADLERLTSDEELLQCTQSRQASLAALPWDIEPNSGFGYDEAIHLLRDPIAQAIEAALDAVFYGYSVTELVEIDGQVVVLPCDIRYFEPDSDGSLWMNKGGKREAQDTTLKFILTRNKPKRHAPQGLALYSRAYWPVTHRNELWRNWISYTELSAWPLLAAKVGLPQAFVDAMSAQGFKVAVAVGKDDEVKALTVPTAGEFATQDTALIRRIQRLILGQTGTSGLQGSGSYAAVEVLSRDVLGSLTLSDAKLVRSAAQQVIRFATAAELIDPGFRFVWRDTKSLGKDRADRDAVLYGLGVRPTDQYYLDRYDFGLGDFELLEVQPQQNFAAKPLERIERAIDTRTESPLGAEQIRQAIEMASNPADLRDKLAEIIPDPEFADAIARMQFNSQILGWESAK